MKTAIITGASSGLGAEYARQLLAREEIEELWLIARRKERMQALAEELQRICPACALRIMPLDLTLEADIQALEQTLVEEKLEIYWLVNAAGMGKMGSNADIGRQALDNMVLLNAKAAMDVTQIAMPYLARGSHVLEICSTAAFQPLGGLGVYAATKSFLLSYSRSLHFEVRRRGIIITAVCPYWIRDTEFIPVARRTKDSTAVRHFPLASRSHAVVWHSLMDTKLGVRVSTPGPVCALHRLVSKFIPRDLLMLAWAGLRRI
jgi:uncharacterized protein